MARVELEPVVRTSSTTISIEHFWRAPGSHHEPCALPSVMGSRATMMRGYEQTVHGAQAAPRILVPYEKRLASDARWALSEGSKFFEEKSAVQEALRKITERLNTLGIPYAVAGGLALFRHGHRRFTEGVDILVTRQGLTAIHTRLEGLGYLPPFPKSKHLRDTDLGVKLEFLVTGDFVQQLAPYVQDKFIELWTATRQVTRRYVRLWRNKSLTLEAQNGGTADDYAYLVTTDPEVAKKYGMDEEDEGWEEEKAEGEGGTET